MAAPVSFSDVLKAIEICKKIYDNCFASEKKARTSFINFRNDIRQLQNRLEQFHHAINDAHNYVGGVDDRVTSTEEKRTRFKKDADELIGDFNSTLQECHQFLQTHGKFEHREGRPVENFRWNASIELKIEFLRKRLQSHTNMITLFVNPLQLDLALENMKSTCDILDFLRRTFGEFPEIPAAIRHRFCENLKKDSPKNIIGPTGIPLREGLDAMMQHFSKSTVLFSGFGSNQTVEQYVNLLKAHWLTEILSQSQELRHTQAGHVYRRAIVQFETHVAKEYSRKEVIRYREDELLRLDEDAFAIWPKKVVIPDDPLPEPGERDEKLASVPLVATENEERELLIFKADDRKLRTVEIRTKNDNPQSRDRISYLFKLDTDVLVPWYTIATSHKTEWSVGLGYDKGDTGIVYPLRSREAAFELQRAFLGYSPSHYVDGAVFGTISKPFSRKSSIFKKIGNPMKQYTDSSGIGEIQIWQWPIVKDMTVSSRQGSVSAENSRATVHSSSTHASRIFHSVNPSITSISQTEKGGELITSSLPPPPLLVAFVKCEGTFTIWQVDISHLIISQTNHGECVTVLNHSDGKTFSVRRLSVSGEQLESWNILSLFIPRQPSSRSPVEKNIEDVDCTCLYLEFKHMGAKDRFRLELLNALQCRHDQLAAYYQSQEEVMRRAERPDRIRSSDRNRTQLGISSPLDPVLPEIPRLSTISLGTVFSSASSSQRHFSKHKDYQV